MGSIIIIGGGPAGLMAAEIIADAGLPVTIYDRMASVGRKFLMAGRGGLNLTHSEPFERFITRYGTAADWLESALKIFSPDDLRSWSEKLGQPTFVGSSGRVFPKDHKTSPLLRAWLRRLDEKGVRLVLKREWAGWDDDGGLLFKTPDGTLEKLQADATLLALGGASWPRLGSDGGWIKLLSNIQVTPLQPANCGFIVPWSEIFRQKYEGQPLKGVGLSLGTASVTGDAMITAKGIEGGAIYALSAPLRDALVATGEALLTIDLRTGLRTEELCDRLKAPRGSQTMSNFLRKHAGLSPVAIGLLYEIVPMEELKRKSAQDLARTIKQSKLRLTAPFPIERAISTAGGISRDALGEHFMLRNRPGVFAAGEMLDWEAPTGGYLLQATFSTAVAAARGLVGWVTKNGKV